MDLSYLNGFLSQPCCTLSKWMASVCSDQHSLRSMTCVYTFSNVVMLLTKCKLKYAQLFPLVFHPPAVDSFNRGRVLCCQLLYIVESMAWYKKPFRRTAHTETNSVSEASATAKIYAWKEIQYVKQTALIGGVAIKLHYNICWNVRVRLDCKCVVMTLNQSVCWQGPVQGVGNCL